MQGKEGSAAAVSLPGDPVQQLTAYENSAARLAAEYEENMVRF
jgi:hypothetical protein